MAGASIPCPACGQVLHAPGCPPPAGLDDPPLPEIRIPTLSLPEPPEPPKPRVQLRLAGRTTTVRRRPRLHTVALICALLGPFGCLPAIVCGHIALLVARKHSRRPHATTALAALAIGYTWMLLTAAFLLRSSLLKP